MSPSRTGPFTLRMMLRLCSPRNSTLTCVHCPWEPVRPSTLVTRANVTCLSILIGSEELQWVETHALQQRRAQSRLSVRQKNKTQSNLGDCGVARRLGEIDLSGTYLVIDFAHSRFHEHVGRGTKFRGAEIHAPDLGRPQMRKRKTDSGWAPKSQSSSTPKQFPNSGSNRHSESVLIPKIDAQLIQNKAALPELHCSRRSSATSSSSE